MCSYLRIRGAARCTAIDLGAWRKHKHERVVSRLAATFLKRALANAMFEQGVADQFNVGVSEHVQLAAQVARGGGARTHLVLATSLQRKGVRDNQDDAAVVRPVVPYAKSFAANPPFNHQHESRGCLNRPPSSMWENKRGQRKLIRSTTRLTTSVPINSP